MTFPRWTLGNHWPSNRCRQNLPLILVLLFGGVGATRSATATQTFAVVIVPGVGPDAPYRATGRAPYALISDIHGNARALDAVLAELERFGIDDGIALGDVAQGGDEPAAVLDRLADLGWPVILGNADHLLLEVPTRTNEVITAEQLARREWSLSKLDERHLDQIRSFHPTYERDGVLAFHGSPRHFEDVLLPDTEDTSPWQVDGYALLLGGHTHFQWTTRMGEAVYVNPGSVGLPVYRWNDRRPLDHAEYAIVHGFAIEFRRCVS